MVLTLMFLRGIASGNLVEARIIVSRNSFSDLVFGNGPIQSIMTLLKKVLQRLVMGTKEHKESSDLASLPFDRYDMTCKSLKHLFL